MSLLSSLLVLVLQTSWPQEADRNAAAAAAADAAAAAAGSQGEGQITCARDGSTLQMNACAGEDLAKEEARMGRYFDLAMERAISIDADSASDRFGEPTRQVELLTAAQDAWSAYAEFRCQGELDKVKGGTIRTIVFVGCKIDAIRQRTHDIWADHLTYWDSTPPMLPEPLLTVFEEQDAAAQRP